MKAKCLWFTGLPCSGKTTLAKQLLRYFPNAQLLDGDELRGMNLAKNVGFSPEDRKNHSLRMGEIAKMLVDNGVTAICSFVSPNRAVRDEVRRMFSADQFVEIHVNTPLSECFKRDVKGMYVKAATGEIPNFTGYSAPYEEPVSPEIVINTENSEEECLKQILGFVEPFRDRAYFFIGRWNGCFHNGHDYIIQQKLKEGPVTLAVRNVAPDENNPWTAKEVKEMLDYRFKDDDVEVIIIPDLLSVEYGRGVGYGINEIKVDKEIEGISGTKCRALIENGDDGWKEFVPKEIAEFLENKEIAEFLENKK
jgi:adenylylsulfate kinase